MLLLGLIMNYLMGAIASVCVVYALTCMTVQKENPHCAASDCSNVTCSRHPYNLKFAQLKCTNYSTQLQHCFRI